jgi:adenine/guanine phosphoribosyltransferase-like PRPP-binding protein
MAERHGAVLKWVANGLLAHLAGYTEDSDSVSFGDIVGFCGAPEGGKALANALAIAFGKQYIFPEKEVTAVKTDSSREVSRLVFDRHEPHEGECWWIMEDVCNNFSTTEAIIELINGFGARVGGILCFLNRSMVAGKAYYSSLYAREIPVVSLVHMPIPQYQQDDPVVAQDVITGNVAWKPKNEWPRLASAMAAAKEHL